ncbi:hypothetical protein KM043_001255 [Ampulex compressa]|nr:hypothetical protein KM043_001255 [Ampulex compressa]
MRSNLFAISNISSHLDIRLNISNLQVSHKKTTKLHTTIQDRLHKSDSSASRSHVPSCFGYFGEISSVLKSHTQIQIKTPQHLDFSTWTSTKHLLLTWTLNQTSHLSLVHSSPHLAAQHLQYPTRVESKDSLGEDSLHQLQHLDSRSSIPRALLFSPGYSTSPVSKSSREQGSTIDLARIQWRPGHDLCSSQLEDDPNDPGSSTRGSKVCGPAGQIRSCTARWPRLESRNVRLARLAGPEWTVAASESQELSRFPPPRRLRPPPPSPPCSAATPPWLLRLDPSTLRISAC